ncbi:MAG: hypothetical protein AABZ53_12925 [Planctomycetota bacterium]
MSDDVLKELENRMGAAMVPAEPPRAFLAAVKGRRVRRRIVRTMALAAVICVAVVTAMMLPMGPTTVAPGPGDGPPAPLVHAPISLPETSWARLWRDNRDLPPEQMVLGSSEGSAPSHPMSVRSTSATTLGL